MKHEKESLEPLGLVPRHIRDLQRLQEVIDAMDRYEESGKEIPVLWLREYAQLSEKLIRGGHL